MIQTRLIDKEQFFTSDEAAKHILQEFRKREPAVWRKVTTILEPSVGGGAFIRAVGNAKRIVGYDIAPKLKGRNIHKRNFLSVNATKFNPRTTMCLGNPPYGAQGKLARMFINKCAEMSEHILMILPISFVKGLRNTSKNLHLQWWIRMPLDIWSNEKGNPVKRTIRTAAIYLKWEKTPRPAPKRITMADINKKAHGWKMLTMKEKFSPNDVVFSRKTPKVELLKNFHKLVRDFIVVRMDKPPSKATLARLLAEVKRAHKQKLRFATVGGLGEITISMVGKIMNKVFPPSKSKE